MGFLLSFLNSDVVAVALAVLLISYYLLCRSKAAKGRSQAPEAAGAWPIIGHLHLLNSAQIPHITLGAMADKYGPAFIIRIGVHRALVLSNWELAKECFTNHDAAISTRPKIVAAKHMGYNYAMFGFSPYGAYWRELRKISSTELLSSRMLELLKHIRASEVEASIKELYKIWTERKNDSSYASVEMKQWLGDLTLNVVVRMVAGKRYFGFGVASEREEARRCQKALRDFFRLVGLFVLRDAVPYLGWLDVGGYEKDMKATAKELDLILEGWLEEHQRRKELDGGDGKPRDFMDVMLSVLEDANLGGHDAGAINKATCLTLISGGSDTITVVLTWALALLMNHPHALKKAQEELDHHVGKDRKVDESDIGNLVYLQAIAKETLRLYPAGPLAGQREFTEDCTVGGYHVPRGTRLILNLWKIQRDPLVWANPSEFQPERFLTTHMEIDVKGQHFELFPFGAGRRACPGILFGLQVLQLTLASLLHAFDFSIPSSSPVDMAETFGLTNAKTTPLEVLVSPRLPSCLYE